MAHSLAVDASGSETKLALAIYESSNDTTVVYSSDDNGDSCQRSEPSQKPSVLFSRYDNNISLVNDSGVFILDINTGELSQEGIEYFANEPLSVQYLMDGNLLVGDIRGVSAQTGDGWSNRYDNFLDYDIVTLGSIESCPDWFLLEHYVKWEVLYPMTGDRVGNLWIPIFTM